MSVSVKNQESPAEVGDSRPVSVRALQIGFVLLVGLAVLGIVLTLWTPYVSHLVWKTVEADIVSTASVISIKPMLATVSSERFVPLVVGPISLEVPESLLENMRTRPTSEGPLLILEDGSRRLMLTLPVDGRQFVQEMTRGFDEVSTWTYPRLFLSICKAQSSDASFAMSAEELRWHRWLLTRRAELRDARTVEYLVGPDMEANFVGMSFGTGRFDWSTTDGRAAGSIYFTESEPTEGTWMRQVCTSFRINPNADFDSLRDETWNALMQMTSNRDDLPGDHGKADR